MVRNPKTQIIFNRYLLVRLLSKATMLRQTKHIYIFDKSSMIPKSFIGLPVSIYKGNLFRKIVVTRYLAGFKFGEFTHTRKPFNYPIVKKKKKNLRR